MRIYPVILIKSRAGQKLGYQLHRNVFFPPIEQIYFIFLRKKSQQSSTVILIRLKITVNTVYHPINYPSVYKQKKTWIMILETFPIKMSIGSQKTGKKIVNILKEVMLVCVKSPHFWHGKLFFRKISSGYSERITPSFLIIYSSRLHYYWFMP